MEKTDFKKLNLDETFKVLASGASGLSAKEVDRRHEQYGYNEIIEKKKSRFVKFALYFWNPISWMVEAAAILSAILQRWYELAIILTLLIINTIIGFWQENKADNAIMLLKKRLAITARALRGGSWVTIPSRDVVPGDMIRVKLGDIVPADIKLVKGEYLLLDEAALTGESLPVEKHRLDVTFSGAIVKQGEMNAVVTAIGQNTYFGETTKLTQEAKTRSHLQKAVVQICDYLIIIALVLVAIVLAVAVFRGQDFLTSVQYALILLTASIPVAMPAVLSVTMAVGAMALAEKEAIVTKLETIDEIAGMDILCADKTGTITKNEITVTKVKCFGGFSYDDVIAFATLASRRENSDPIETAIFKKADEGNAFDIVESYRVVKYHPFDPISKRTEAICLDRNSRSTIIATKGAPQAIISLLSSGRAVSNDVNKAVEKFASKGYRTIAVAKGTHKSGFRIVGLLALYDPPREDSKETIKSAEGMGIDIKLITGDHTAIAREMCKEVGIGKNIVKAQILQGLSTKSVRIERANAFAEVFPENKYSIVDILQKMGHIVGMTGDGVNDVPALKKADAGIAVSGATDAAKSAANIVLIRPGLSVIIDAIKQSRIIFERMNNYVVYRIAETIRVLFLITLAIVIFNFYPLTVVMLIFLALLNDIPIMMIAYDNVEVHDKPVKWDMKSVLSLSSFLGIVGVITSAIILLLGIYVFHLNNQALQTLIFLKMAVAGHMTIYLARTGKKHFWSRPFPAGRLFFTTEITQIVATIFVASGILMTSISVPLVLFVWGYALTCFVIVDSLKVRLMKHISTNDVSAPQRVPAAS